MYSLAASTCFLVILHLTIRMMTTTVHTNISSTSVDGITVLRMMVDTGAGWGSGVGKWGRRIGSYVASNWSHYTSWQLV